MTEPRMVFWSVAKLAKEFRMSKTAVSRLLSSIGASVWSGTRGGRRIYYWDPEEG
jgi:hypothetical protein